MPSYEIKQMVTLTDDKRRIRVTVDKELTPEEISALIQHLHDTVDLCDQRPADVDPDEKIWGPGPGPESDEND